MSLNVAKFDDFDVSGEVVSRQFLHSCDVCTHVSNSLILAAFFLLLVDHFIPGDTLKSSRRYEAIKIKKILACLQ